MKFTVYILCSTSTGKYYCGQTQDFDKRLIRHNNHGSPHTKNRGPWALVYSLTFATRSEAMKFEKRSKKVGVSKFLSSQTLLSDASP